jgi:hypothetical protein
MLVDPDCLELQLYEGDLMRILRRADIDQVHDLVVIPVPIPEWGEDAGVYVRMLTVGERDQLENAYARLKEESPDERGWRDNFRARACAAFLSDDKRNPLYTEDEVEELGQKSAAALERIFDAGRRLNRMFLSKEESAEKNLLGTPGAGSSTGSPGDWVVQSPGSKST